MTISSEDTAPYGVGGPPDSSPEGKARNRAANREMQYVFLDDVQLHLIKVLESTGASGTPPFVLDGGITVPDRFLQLSIPSFDYPRSDLPETVRYVGALPAGASPGSSLPEWWGEVTAARRPVVVVTQGTLANFDFSELVQPTLDALADLDVLVVATLGRDAELERVPANARVARYIPYDELLPHAAVVVTNGGYGGVQQVLGHGVPLVAAGLTEDKIEVTARIAWSGTGINLATQRPEPADIRTAVESVLAEPAYRRRARELATEYASYDPFTAIHQTVTDLLG